jgi:hypothetical protein
MSPGLDPDRLDVQIFVQVLQPGLPSIAAHLVTAEGHGRIHGLIAVDPDGTGADRLREEVGLADVARTGGGRRDGARAYELATLIIRYILLYTARLMRQSGCDNAAGVLKSMLQTGRKRHHAMQYGPPRRVGKLPSPPLA